MGKSGSSSDLQQLRPGMPNTNRPMGKSASASSLVGMQGIQPVSLSSLGKINPALGFGGSSSSSSQQQQQKYDPARAGNAFGGVEVAPPAREVNEADILGFNANANGGGAAKNNLSTIHEKNSQNSFQSAQEDKDIMKQVMAKNPSRNTLVPEQERHL